MKKLLLITLTLLSISVSASAQMCQKEAQIIVDVTSVRQESSSVCRVEVGYPSLYNPSQVCPLDIIEVLTKSILISGKCPLRDHEISGVVVEKNGNLVLEN